MSKEYEIPDNYLPGGYRCLKIFVPDEDHYVDQFWAAYEFFAQWTAWARDDLKRGKQVAYKWRVGFDMARQLFETFGGCDMAITGIRANPANKCELQYSSDNGSSWVTFANIQDCASSGGIGGLHDITIENNVIVGKDQCGDTVPLGPQSESRYNGEVVPLYPNANQGDNCIAGANAANYLQNELKRWSNIRLTVIGYIQTVLDILQGLSLVFPEGAWSIPIWEAFAVAYEWSEDWWNDIAALDIEADLAAIISAYYEPNGTMTRENHAALVDEMKSHYSGPPTTTSTESAWFIVTFIVNRLGTVGMSRISTAGGITTADCSASNFRHVWDFTANSGNWSKYGAPEIDPLLETAKFTAPYWHSVLFNGGGVDPANYRACGIIATPVQAFTLTGIKVVYDLDGGSTEVLYTLGANFDYKSGGVWTNDEATNPAEGNEQVLQWSGNVASVQAIRVQINCGYDGTAPYTDPGGVGAIRRIEITGLGIDPFN